MQACLVYMDTPNMDEISSESLSPCNSAPLIYKPAVRTMDGYFGDKTGPSAYKEFTVR